jgi:hypothetical protein
MPTITLLAKAYSGFQKKVVDEVLKDTLGDLNASVRFVETTSRGWARVNVSGEDEKIAMNLLEKEIGICPVELHALKEFSTVKGLISALDKNKNVVSVDIGVHSPEIVDATVPLHDLQAQLADGRKVPLGKIANIFGFCKNLPLNVKILRIDSEESQVETSLAERQLEQYRGWTRSMFDRLIVLGASSQNVEWALNVNEYARDVVAVEPLGLFENAIVCKLGTDAAGLIPSIGKSLCRATLTVFSPRRIIEFLGNDTPLLIF